MYSPLLIIGERPGRDDPMDAFVPTNDESRGAILMTLLGWNYDDYMERTKRVWAANNSFHGMASDLIRMKVQNYISRHKEEYEENCRVLLVGGEVRRALPRQYHKESLFQQIPMDPDCNSQLMIIPQISHKLKFFTYESRRLTEQALALFTLCVDWEPPQSL